MTGHSLRCRSVSMEDDDARSKQPRSEFVDDDREDDALFVDAVRLDASEIGFEEIRSCSLPPLGRMLRILDLREEELAWIVVVVEHMILCFTHKMFALYEVCVCGLHFMRPMMQINAYISSKA